MKHKDIIDKMKLEEKAALLSGKGEWQTWDFERLGIPSMYCSDGPNGVRRQAGAGDHLGLNPSLRFRQHVSRRLRPLPTAGIRSLVKRSGARSARRHGCRASMSCLDRA